MIYTSDFTKIDMHVHTRYTYGSSLSLGDIEKFLNKNQDFGLAITDINCIDGALALHEKYPSRIVVGSQIISNQGAITGLFLKETIPGGRDLNWTIDAILVQDGLVCIPHPYDRQRKAKLSSNNLAIALKRCDLVEIFNSRTIHSDDNKRTVELLKSKQHILPVCGSDAHTKFEVGRTYITIPANSRLVSSDFYNALIGAELICRKTSIIPLLQTNLHTTYQKLTKK